jgi:hypothetical protein
MATSIPRTPRNAPAKAARSPVPGIVAVLLFFSLIGGAIYVAVWADRANSSSAQEPVEDSDAHKPFSSVEPEALPDMSGRKRDDGRPTAPGSLATTPVWKKALVIAEDGWKYAAEAAEALAGDDRAVYREKGKLAEHAFDKAFTMTAIWEEELLDKYSDSDPQVRDIVRTRNKWIDKVRHFHKTAPGR